MSSPQNSAGRYKQKARATKQLAEWRLRQPAKASTAAVTAAAPKAAATPKPAAAAAATKPASR